jgi:hypothetical protein
MLNFDIAALNRIVAAMQSLKAAQIDFHYWRKTPVGTPFAITVACPGGWLCMLRTFEVEGLRLLAVSPDSDWGFVPALIAPNKQELRGYPALGTIVQAVKNPDTAEMYGRALFSFPGASVLDKPEAQTKLDALMNPKGFMLRRLTTARTMAEPPPAKVHYVAADD